MKSHKPKHRLSNAIAWLALGMTTVHAVPIGIPASADHWLSENSITGGIPGNPLDVPDGQGAAASPVLQVRWSADRNEAAVLRFDLTGQNRAIIAGAGVCLINYAVNGSHTLHFYGIVDGTTGFNAITSTPSTATDDNWPEDTTTYSTTPCLTYDADSTTRGLDPVGTVDLGPRAFGADTAEGAAMVFTSAALTDFRDNNATPQMRFHGVLDEATGYNSITSTEGTFTDDNWPEDAAMTFAEVPGVNHDGNTSTPAADPTRTVDLGTVAMSDGAGNRLMGTKVVLATPALIDFLKNHPDNVVTILVSTTTASSGQKRFTTKEATQLNTGEQTRGTNPNDPDSDDDGLTDLVETKTGIWVGASDTGTNPLVADTDSDGLLDGVENPDLPFVNANQTGSNPNLVDADGDIYPDGGEVARTSNPANFNIVPNGAVLELLGIGTGALEFGPLTDPEEDIIDNTPAGENFNWKAITSLPAKNFFGTGSFGVDPDNMSGAFDLFDNKVGGANDNNDKWLAGGVTAAGGVHVTVEFPGTASLATFNIASANDRPERDPVDWQILGSTDGENFTPIFTQADPGNLTLWKLRGQVIKCTLAAPTAQYRYLRFACTRASQGEGTAHVYELQYFGTLTPDAAISDFRITGFTGGPRAGDIALTWTSQPGDNYRIAYSTSLTDAFISTAASNIPAGAGSTTTQSFPNPLPAAPRLFFRVEKE